MSDPSRAAAAPAPVPVPLGRGYPVPDRAFHQPATGPESRPIEFGWNRVGSRRRDAMATTGTGRDRRGLLDQAVRFVLFGVLAAGVDFGIYQLLLNLGLWADLAKAISFICG